MIGPASEVNGGQTLRSHFSREWAAQTQMIEGAGRHRINQSDNVNEMALNMAAKACNLGNHPLIRTHCRTFVKDGCRKAILTIHSARICDVRDSANIYIFAEPDLSAGMVRISTETPDGFI